MPRLLLVDDNPSIHKIAETLLATSPIVLVCVDSAAAALEKVNRGEHFDVALLDTSMAGMDGWELLARLRAMPATARMPIAMMAGVLDTVDPERIQAAPIQGFLKKPVELRELGDRVARLMETPVPLPEPPAPEPRAVSPFATMPATHLADLPEFRKKQAAQEEAAEITASELVKESEEDLLELTEADLYPEPAAVEPPAEPEEESLDLEELDLDNLQNLSEPTLEPLPAVPDQSAPTPQEESWPVEALDAIATLDRLPSLVPVEEPASFLAEPLAESWVEPITEPSAEVDLPDLGAPSEELMDITSLSNLPEIEEIITTEPPAVPPDMALASLLEESREEATFTPPLPPLEESLDWSDESESLLAAVEAPGAIEPGLLSEEELDLVGESVPDQAPVSVPDQAFEAVPEPLPESETLQLDLDEARPLLDEPTPAELPETVAGESTEAIITSALLESAAAPAEEPEVPPIPAPSLGSRELLDAMLADPALMDALAKAVVARLGDQALREIAWEVMPELAERLPRS